jgi:hypothetical protein
LPEGENSHEKQNKKFDEYLREEGMHPNKMKKVIIK